MSVCGFWGAGCRVQEWLGQLKATATQGRGRQQLSCNAQECTPGVQSAGAHLRNSLVCTAAQGENREMQRCHEQQ